MPHPLLLARRALLATSLLIATCATAHAQGRREVIIDQDMFGPGGSNMNSVLMLLQAPDVDVLGIVVSSGDGWRDEEIAQTLRMLELVGRTDVPVYAGAQFPLLNSAARLKAWEHRYGPLVWKGAWTESFGGQPRAEYHADPALVPPLAAGAPTLKAQAESGIAFMIRTVRQRPGRVTLWMGGALTDLALAARQDPGFAAARVQHAVGRRGGVGRAARGLAAHRAGARRSDDQDVLRQGALRRDRPCRHAGRHLRRAIR